MACGSCTTENGQPKGCKNNGTCGSDGCNKLTVFDWLSNMSLPSGEKPFDFVEVRFKNGRKEYFKNSDNFSLQIGDVVATQAMSGHDIGLISLTGELVKIQMKRKRISTKPADIQKIYRKATQKDIDIWQEARDREDVMKVRARQIAIALQLEMKISDIEFQGDASKATFYYTAEQRVDFRQLIKDFAKEFNIRIEMKQVGFRQEASRLGGIGSCGRELCCSTWLTDFRSVNTSAARYQQLSLNPQKLAGQCGKLKCCLNFELDAYVEALHSFPKTDTKIYTQKGTAVCQKIDIFKGVLWYAYEGEWMNWFMVKAEDANEMIRRNKAKEPVEALEEFSFEDKEEEKVEFENVVGQDSLTRFDQPKRRRNNRRKSGSKTSNSNHSRNTENKKPQRQRNNRVEKGASDSSSSETTPQAKVDSNQSNNPNSNKKRRPQRRKPKPNAKTNTKPNNKPTNKPNNKANTNSNNKSNAKPNNKLNTNKKRTD